jgi:hypothetical protein
MKLKTQPIEKTSDTKACWFCILKMNKIGKPPVRLTGRKKKMNY